MRKNQPVFFKQIIHLKTKELYLVEEENTRQKLKDKKLVPFWCSSKILPLYGRRKNCTFVVFFEQFIDLKENLHYYNVLYAKKKKSTDEENIHSLEKKYITKYIKMVEAEKIREKKKNVVPMLSSSNMSSISNKNFIHHSKKRHAEVLKSDRSRKHQREDEKIVSLLSQRDEWSTRFKNMLGI